MSIRGQLGRQNIQRECKIVGDIGKHSPKFGIAVEVRPLIPPKSDPTDHPGSVPDHLLTSVGMGEEEGRRGEREGGKRREGMREERREERTEVMREERREGGKR
jgi:hypothetical protein